MRQTLAEQVDSELKAGEQLLWSGRGARAAVFTRSDLFLIPFTLLWCGFAFSWTADVLAKGDQPVFALVGFVFAGVGVYVVLGRFFVKDYRKRTTAYAVTDRRAFVKTSRTTVETKVSNGDRSATWTRDKKYVTVLWTSSSGINRGIFGRGSTVSLANSGMEAIGSPTLMAFFDISDGKPLMEALDRVVDSRR